MSLSQFLNSFKGLKSKPQTATKEAVIEEVPRVTFSSLLTDGWKFDELVQAFKKRGTSNVLQNGSMVNYDTVNTSIVAIVQVDYEISPHLTSQNYVFYGHPRGKTVTKSWLGVNNKETTDVLEITGWVHQHVGADVVGAPAVNASHQDLVEAIRIANDQVISLLNLHAVVYLPLANQVTESSVLKDVFTYVGLSDKREDFYAVDNAETGTFRKNKRGTTADKDGVWLPRVPVRRHYYITGKAHKPCTSKDFVRYSCCNGEGVVEDKRTTTQYTCPVCTNKLMEVRP